MPDASLICPKCSSACAYSGLRPDVGGKAPAYFVGWACTVCDGAFEEHSLLGPLLPSAASCVHCGAQELTPEGSCAACGYEPKWVETHFRIYGPALRKPVGNAKVAFSKGDFRQGIALLNLGLRDDFDQGEAWEMKLDFMLRLGYRAEAKAMLGAALEAGAPQHLYRQLAAMHLDEGELEEAADALQVFIADSNASMKEKAEELSNLGNIFAALGLTTDAESAHVAASQMDPLNARIAQNHAAFLVEEGRFEEADPVCSQGLLIAADNAERADLLALQAYITCLGGEIELAQGTLELAISLGKDDLQTMMLLGRLQAMSGDFEAAKATLVALAAQHPNNEDVHIALDEVAAMSGAELS